MTALNAEELAVDHPYYGTGNNGEKYATFQQFFDEMNKYDVDLNLCYRWDIAIGEDGNYYAHIFTIQQRKGKIINHFIEKFTDEDVPLFQEYLKPHIATMIELWNPFDLTNSLTVETKKG